MWVPFLMCLVLTGIHAYLGLHVIAREVVFVDIALAQIAALGATAAFLWRYDLDSWGSYAFALSFTILGASTSVDYVLQETSELCDCSCKIEWRDVMRLSPEERDSTSVQAVMQPLSDAIVTDPDAPLPVAIARMAQAGTARLLVMRGDRLVGLLTMHGVVRRLKVREELAGERRAIATSEAPK